MKDGYREEGVPDMTVMSDINETGINNNLQLRYKNDNIYVSTNFVSICYCGLLHSVLSVQSLKNVFIIL